jgi:predicted glutamine amidotransferase
VDLAGDVERGVREAARALRALGDVGAASFLFSDGERLYAHRSGRALFALERGDDRRRTRSIAIASEPLTDEAWREIEPGALLVVASDDRPRAERLSLD